MSLTANLNRDPKGKPEPFTALDFMNFVEQETEKKMTQEEIDKELDRIFR